MISLIETIIGQLSDEIEVVLSVDKTQHAADRQHRHDTEIQENEIMRTANKAIKKLTKLLIFDRIDIGDKVHIHDNLTKLNLVGQIQENEGKLQLKIITVMRKEIFHPYNGTTTIKV